MSPTAPDPAGAERAHDSSGMVPGVDHAGLTRWLSTVLRARHTTSGSFSESASVSPT